MIKKSSLSLLLLFLIFTPSLLAQKEKSTASLAIGIPYPTGEKQNEFKKKFTGGASFNFGIFKHLFLQLNYFRIWSDYHGERPDFIIEGKKGFFLNELTLSAKISTKFAQRFNPYLLLGRGWFHHKFSGGHHRIGWVYGAGTEYRLSNRISLLLGFRGYDISDEFSPVRNWISVFAGFTFHFKPLRVSLTEAEKSRIVFNYLATPEQKKKIINIDSKEELERFAKRYWEANDPTPKTPENEFKTECISRVDYVQDHFSSAHIPGWKTDQGRIWIILGEPNEIYRSTVTEMWIYWREYKGIIPIIFIFREISPKDFQQVDTNIPGEVGYKGENFEVISKRYEFLTP